MWQFLIQLFICNEVLSRIAPNTEEIPAGMIYNVPTRIHSGFLNSGSYSHTGEDFNYLPPPDLLIPISFVPLFENEEHAQRWASSGNTIIHNIPDLSLFYDIQPVPDHIGYSHYDTSSRSMSKVHNTRPEARGSSKNYNSMEMTSTHSECQAKLQTGKISEKPMDHGVNFSIGTSQSSPKDGAQAGHSSLGAPYLPKVNSEKMRYGISEEGDPTREYTYSNKAKISDFHQAGNSVLMTMKQVENRCTSSINHGDKISGPSVSNLRNTQTGHDEWRKRLILKNNLRTDNVEEINHRIPVISSPPESQAERNPGPKLTSFKCKNQDVTPSANPIIVDVDNKDYTQGIKERGEIASVTLKETSPDTKENDSRGKHLEEIENDENKGILVSKNTDEWRIVCKKKNKRKGKKFRNVEFNSPEIPNGKPLHVSSHQIKDNDKMIANAGIQGNIILGPKSGTSVLKEGQEHLETFPPEINNLNLSSSSSQLKPTEISLSKPPESNDHEDITTHEVFKVKRKKNNKKKQTRISKHNIIPLSHESSSIEQSKPSSYQLAISALPKRVGLSEKKKILLRTFIEDSFQKHNKDKFVITLIDNEYYAQELYPVGNMELDAIIDDMQLNMVEAFQCPDTRESFRRLQFIKKQLIQENLILKWNSRRDSVSKEVSMVAQLLKVNDRWPTFLETKPSHWDSLLERLAKLNEVQQNELDSSMDKIERDKRCATIYTMQNPKLKRYKKWLEEKDPKKLSQLGISIPILLNLLYTLDFLSPEIDWENLNRKILHKKSDDFFELLIGLFTVRPNVYTLEELSWINSPTRMYIGQNEELENFIQSRLKILTKLNRFKILAYRQWFPADFNSHGSIQEQNLSYSEVIVATYFGIPGSEVTLMKSLMDEKSKNCLQRGSGVIKWPKAAAAAWILSAPYLEKYYNFLGLTVHPPEH
ncbi:hypothetical protein DFH28DRAFT_1033535, partial [Melampsora americana]